MINGRMNSKVVLFVIAVLVALLGAVYQQYGQSYFGFGCGFEEASELLIRSKRVVTPDSVLSATIHVNDGKILEVIPITETQKLKSLENLKTVDYGELVISPGLIDSHVHFNEPGLDQREGIASGTKSGVVGGVTTVGDMPMPSSPPTDSCARLKAKIFRFKREAFSNMGAWGGITAENFDRVEDLKCMVEVGGVFGFHSDFGFNDNIVKDASSLHPVNPKQLAAAISILKSLGVSYSIQPRFYETAESGDSSKSDLELKAVEKVIAILEESQDNSAQPGFRIHFTRVGSAKTIQAISHARDNGLPVSVELSPHYLHFTEHIAAGNPLLKTDPPIGSDANRVELCQAVKNGSVDLISSDHSPALPSEKSSEADNAFPGVSGIQYLLPVVWTGLSAQSTTDVDLILISQLLSSHPAQLLGLKTSKGAIAKGFDADLVIWDPEGSADTTPKACHMQHPSICPYMNASLKGSVKATWLKGNLIFDHSKGLSQSSCRKIYGLGDWARIVVLWFYEVSFAE